MHSNERVAASATNKANEDLLHDWKAFRDNIREKVGQMEKCNTARVAPTTVSNRDQSKEEVSSPNQQLYQQSRDEGLASMMQHKKTASQPKSFLKMNRK